MSNEKLKVLELFGGIGAFSRALDHLKIDYEIADYVEINKYAVKSYNAIHNTNFQPQDICKWDKDIEVDLIMHGSPCQDFSTAGKNKGGDEGSGTRSSLMYETIRIIEKLKPKYVIWENVKNLISKKHHHNFSKYLIKLEQLGYVSNYKVLNAKDYGIPQNRERIFTISIRNDIKWQFTFPPKKKLELRLRDLLEKEVDEKYFLSDKMMKYICANNEKWSGNNGESTINKSVATTLNTGEGHRICDASNYVCENVADDFDLKKVKLLGGVGSKGSTDQYRTQNRIYSSSSPSINTAFNPYVDDPLVNKLEELAEIGQEELRIRKLTPKECLRLMGLKDEDIELISEHQTNALLYHLAGDSLITTIMMALFSQMLGTNWEEHFNPKEWWKNE